MVDTRDQDQQWGRELGWSTGTKMQWMGEKAMAELILLHRWRRQATVMCGAFQKARRKDLESVHYEEMKNIEEINSLT